MRSGRTAYGIGYECGCILRGPCFYQSVPLEASLRKASPMINQAAYHTATPSAGRRGVFVTLEGIDGVGKTTQASLLKNALLQEGREVVSLREPGGTKVGEQVRGLLLDPATGAVDPVCELLLYEAARAQLVSEVILPALGRGAVVVSDRFFDSTSAYQGLGRGLGLEKVERANSLACGDLAPDRTLILEIDPREAYRRATEQGADRMELEGADFEERVRGGYDEVARIHPDRIRRIDASGTVDEVWHRVRMALSDLLELPEQPPHARQVTDGSR